MARVKRGNVSRKKHKKVLKLTKGFRGSLSKLYRPAKQALLHALSYAYKDRRLKKRDFRALWIARINASLEMKNVSYSKFMGQCKKKNVEINRKILAELAITKPDTFNEIVQFVTK